MTTFVVFGIFYGATVYPYRMPCPCVEVKGGRNGNDCFFPEEETDGCNKVSGFGEIVGDDVCQFFGGGHGSHLYAQIEVCYDFDTFPDFAVVCNIVSGCLGKSRCIRAFEVRLAELVGFCKIYYMFFSGTEGAFVSNLLEVSLHRDRIR